MVFVVSMLCGAASSAIPLPERETSAEVRRPGAGRSEPLVTMRLVEQRHGVPFNVYTVQKGPVEETVRTYARVHARPLGVAFNIAVYTVLGMLLLVVVTRSAPKQPDV